MNKIISIVFLLTLLYLPVKGADNSAEPSQIIFLKEIGNNRDNRPRNPSRQQVTCLYDGECVYLSFLVPEGQCNLIITEQNIGVTNYYIFNSEDEIAIPVGIIKSSILRIDTEFGKSYEGLIE